MKPRSKAQLGGAAVWLGFAFLALAEIGGLLWLIRTAAEWSAGRS